MIRIDGVAKTVGATRILDGIDLAMEAGGFVALLGASGSGKTTLLRIIAGLDRPDCGTIEIGGRAATDLPPGERGIGFVFQTYALFEHMTVFENVAFGLRVKARGQRPSQAKIAASVRDLLALVRLDGLDARLPGQLSGGQRQRVALARALAVEPRILLLDEPFSALDREVREQLRGWLKELHASLGITTVFVTHDHEEAEALADRIVLLERGRIVSDRPNPRTANTVPGTSWHDGLPTGFVPAEPAFG